MPQPIARPDCHASKKGMSMDIQGWTVGFSLFYEILISRGHLAYTAPLLYYLRHCGASNNAGEFFFKNLLIKIKAIYADGNNPKTS